MEVAMAAAKSARLLELKDMSDDEKAKKLRKEIKAIEDKKTVRRPTEAQARMLALVEKKSEAVRSETANEKKARHRRGHELIRKGPDADTRAQLNRSHARRVAEQKRMSAVQQ